MLAFLFKHLSKIFLIGDFIILNLCYALGYFYFFEFNDGNIPQYKVQIFLLNMAWLAITLITKPYQTAKVIDSSLHFNALTKSLILFVLVTYTYLVISSDDQLNLKIVALYFLLLGSFLVVDRFLIFLIRKKYRISLGESRFSYNSVLVGENDLVHSYLSNTSIKKSLGVRGFYSLETHSTSKHALGNINQFISDLESKKFTNIIFCDDSIDIDLYKKLVEIAEHKMVRIYMSPNFKYSNLGPYYLDNDHDVPLLKLLREPLSNPNKQLLKRTFDIIFASFVIIFLLSWLVPLVALIIKIESGESVFFKQKRSGLKNEPFNCLKFRSMKSNDIADIKTVTKNDNRITKFGAFIRKTSIDELPQFINVFFGDMSVVGPRPHMLSQTEIYSKITKKYMTRHMVKPGITGWAQVMGSRGEIFTHKDMERRIEKDIWYIQNWSFFLDLKIIFLTVYNIVKGDEQAY